MSAKPPLRLPILHDDGHHRCDWPFADPIYKTYHDTEWGVPETDSRALYEKLILDGFQAGLSWITILRKRENFRSAFDQFDPEKIARYDQRKVAKLMADAGIVRNRAKIEGAITSARAFLEIQEREGFSHFLWRYVDGRPLQGKRRHMGEWPAQTDLSARISKDLKKAGFNFCGPTIVYAFMQATGFVNDHLTGCWRHDACAQMGEHMKDLT